MQGVRAILLHRARMHVQKVAQCQRGFLCGRDRSLHTWCSTQPAVVADVPAGRLSGIGRMIEIRDAFDASVMTTGLAAVTDPACRFFEKIAFGLSSFAADQDASTEDGRDRQQLSSQRIVGYENSEISTASYSDTRAIARCYSILHTAGGFEDLRRM